MQSRFIDSETPLRHQHAQIAGKQNVTHRCVIDCMRDKIVSPPTLLCPSPVSPLASQLGPAGVAYGASKFHRVRQNGKYFALIRPLCCGKLFGHVVHDIITPYCGPPIRFPLYAIPHPRDDTRPIREPADTNSTVHPHMTPQGAHSRVHLLLW